MTKDNVKRIREVVGKKIKYVSFDERMIGRAVPNRFNAIDIQRELDISFNGYIFRVLFDGKLYYDNTFKSEHFYDLNFNFLNDIIKSAGIKNILGW